MKYFLFAFLMIPGLLISQPEGYVLTVFIDDYTPLDAPTLVAQSGDFVPYPGLGLLLEKTVPLEFNYQMFDHSTNNLYFNFHCCLVSELLLTQLSNQKTTIMGPRVKLTNRPGSGLPTNITTQTVGDAGERITKLQWRNFGLQGDASQEEYINFQVWIYEQGQVYEYRMGPRNVTSEFYANFVTGKPTFSFVHNMTNFSTTPTVEGFFYATAMNPPAMNELNNQEYTALLENENPEIGLDHFPTEGTVFRITDGSLVTTRGIMLNDLIEVYPTVTNVRFNVELTHEVFEGTISLFDLNGKLVFEQQAQSGTHSIEVANLPAGTYILNVRNEKESVFYKVVKF